MRNAKNQGIDIPRSPGRASIFGGVLWLSQFVLPGDGMIGFEVEIGPILLDPGGGVVQIVWRAALASGGY